MRGVTGFVLAGAVLAAGCSGTVAGPTPGPNGPLRLSVSQLPTFVGGTVLLAIRLDNISDSVVNLTFPSSCQLLPYFYDRAGRPVTPVGGGQACLTVVTNLSLAAGVSLIEPVTVKPGIVPESRFVILPPGEYTIRGRLEDTTYKLESSPVAFTMQ